MAGIDSDSFAREHFNTRRQAQFAFASVGSRSEFERRLAEFASFTKIAYQSLTGIAPERLCPPPEVLFPSIFERESAGPAKS